MSDYHDRLDEEMGRYSNTLEATHFNKVQIEMRLDELKEKFKMQPAETPKPSASTTIGVFLKGGARLYTYQCERPVEPGDLVNVKLPSNQIVTTKVEEVHERPQLSIKWETKWAVVVKTKAQAEADSAGVAEEVSDLSKSLGL